MVRLFISLMLICVGLFNGGFVRSVGQAKIPHDFPRVNVEMNVDASEKATLQTLLNIQGVINTIDKDIEAGNKQAIKRNRGRSRE